MKDKEICKDCKILKEMELRLKKQEELIKALQNRLSLDSHNSHKPPSSDGFKKKIIKSLRKATGRNPGGQPGHKGEALKMIDNPQRMIGHKIERCKGCQRSLEDIEPIQIKKRQVFDIPPVVIEVVEHQAEVKRCTNCGTINEAIFPEDVRYPVQYGERIKSLIVYFTNYQLIPYERTREIFSDLFNHDIATGTLYNVNQECYEKLEATENIIKEQIINSPIVHFDETGISSNNKRLLSYIVQGQRL